MKITFIISSIITLLACFYFVYILSLRKRKNISKNILLMSAFLVITSIIFLIVLGYFMISKKNKFRRTENTFIHSNYKKTTGINGVFGIDVSHNNGNIKWEKIKQSKHNIHFVFIRSTMGTNAVDKKYYYNITNALKNNFICGSYHFYRPNEDPIEQFKNFKSNSLVEKGHLIPVLDIEETGEQKTETLIKNIEKWLELAQAEFGVKPIIYSGKDFYTKIIKNRFNGYPLWVANYTIPYNNNKLNYYFHQFTDKVIVQGSNENIDGNYFKGTKQELIDSLTIK